MQRGDLDAHIAQVCPLEVIPCVYNKSPGMFDQGCQGRMQRKDMDAHKEVCTFRKVQCENPGCMNQIVFKYL